MTAQIRFALQLYRHSGRWLAPLVVLMVWFLFAIENAPPSFDTLAALFPAFLTVGCWVAASLGDVDDRNHREMAAAAAGSRGRLHSARAAASLTVCMCFALLQSIYVSLALEQQGTSTITVGLVCLATLFGACALGVSIGSWLHAPLVSRRAVSVSGGFVAVVLIVLLSPVQDALKKLGNSEVAPAIVLAACTLGAAALAAIGSSIATERSSN